MAAATQPVILTIHYTKIMLPSMVGIEAIIRALSKGVLVDDLTYKNLIEVRSEPMHLGFDLVSPKTRIVREGDPLCLEAK